MTTRPGLWRWPLAAVGGAGAALTMGLLAWAQDLSPRPDPGALAFAAVPLDRRTPARVQVGALRYAGGLMLNAGDASSFGGLSGLVTTPDGPDGLAVTAISDEGRIFRFRAQLDPQGRLAGVQDLRSAALHEGGAPLGRGKARGDAEDIALVGDETLVSLEYDNRVLRMADPFDPDAAVARLALPAAVRSLPIREGLEALASVTHDGRQDLALGAEDGRIWLCAAPLSPTPDCRTINVPPPAPGFKLTALKAVPGSRDFVALYRAFDVLQGWRARVEHLSATGGGYRAQLLARLAPPMTVDNMEGLSILPDPTGTGWRLYLLSDDNFRDDERTLLLAFDWIP